MRCECCGITMCNLWEVYAVYTALGQLIPKKSYYCVPFAVVVQGGVVAGLGVLPPSSAISWVPAFMSGVVPPVMPSLSATSSAGSVVPAAISLPALSTNTTGFPVGTYLGEGLLPVPDKLVQKIVRLEYIEMRELMPETWLKEEDEGKQTLSWPKRRTTPVTDILQWLQCYAAMVGVLSKAYPSMVPEFMSYQATIIKCARDFDGLAWAQYDRAYRRQVAQTKELRWSKLNPTLYSLCFAGKARRHVVCSFCLSDNHSSEQCPENPNCLAASLPLYHTPAVPAPVFGGAPRAEKLCNLFNAKEGPRCGFRNCKFAHKCSACRGAHARAYCRRSADVSEAAPSGGRVIKRPRTE